MCGDKLDQAQAAGHIFLDSMALPPDQASIVSFAGSGMLHIGLTTNRVNASNALDNISCGGISRMDVGLNSSFDEMTGPRRVAGHTPARCRDPLDPRHLPPTAPQSMWKTSRNSVDTGLLSGFDGITSPMYAHHFLHSGVLAIAAQRASLSIST